MDPIARCVRVARFRLLVQSWLAALGWLTVAALAVALLLILTDRLLGVAMGWPIYAGLAVLAVGLAGVLAWWKRPTSAAVAAMIDHRLNLHDTLSTALYARRLDPADGFAQQVIEDARRQAAGLSVRQAFTWHLTRSWAWVLPLGLLTAGLALYMPHMNLLEPSEQPGSPAWAGAGQEQVFEQAMARMDDLANRPGVEDEDPLAALRSLEQLADQDRIDPARRAQAMERMSQVQDQLADHAAQQREQAQAIQNMMSRIEPQATGPADDLADALRRSDFDTAAQAAQQLAEQVDQMTPQQREQLAEQLLDMAEQLQQQAQQQAQRQQQAEQTAREALEQAGLNPEQIDQLAKEQFDPDQVQKALEEQGQSSQQARQTAQQVQREKQKSQSAGECADCASGLANSMKRMGQAAGNQPSGQPADKSKDMQQAADQAARQLSDMGKNQKQPQQTDQAREQLQRMMQQLASSPESRGRTAGQGTAPLDLANQPDPIGPYQTDPQRVSNRPADPDARMLGDWVRDDQLQPGQANVPYDAAVGQARQQAEQAVNQQHVPRQYHQPIRRYFDQLPDTVQAEQDDPSAR